VKRLMKQSQRSEFSEVGSGDLRVLDGKFQ
jgi:hypothetical protein